MSNGMEMSKLGTKLPEMSLEERINTLIAEQVKGGMSPEQHALYLELTAQRSRLMRPTAGKIRTGGIRRLALT